MHYCNNTPIILVGTKTDLRDDKVTLEAMRQRKEKMITFQEVRHARVLFAVLIDLRV